MEKMFPYTIKVIYPQKFTAVITRRNVRAIKHAMRRIEEAYPEARFTVVEWPSTEPYTTTLTNAQ